MNEVAGGAAILIDPAEPTTAARTIACALEDTIGTRARGLRNAASYTTERMLEQCEVLYRDIVNAYRAQR